MTFIAHEFHELIGKQAMGDQYKPTLPPSQAPKPVRGFVETFEARRSATWALMKRSQATTFGRSL